MDATSLLKQQHDEVADLFEQYEAAEDPAEKRELFVKIADDVSAHAAIEEKLFYPAVYVGETEDMLREAVEEHLSLKRVIADLLEANGVDAQFDAKMKVLKEQIEHHVEEEEGELFPQVKQQFSREELSALGEEMEAMFEDMKQMEPRNDVLAETDRPASLQ